MPIALQQHSSPSSRIERISQARRLALHDGAPLAGLDKDLLEPWIAKSWQRSLARGHRPHNTVVFKPVSSAAMRETAESNRQLAQAGRAVLRQLGAALADTRYFVILANHNGVVVDSDGPIDRQDRRATDLVRVGVDLSEAAVGAGAIAGALHEEHPVWIHRGEHFFDSNGVYSCGAAPLYGPNGTCVGVLNFTGIDAVERPELRHLAAQAARQIENALLKLSPHRLLLRLNWPGLPLGSEGDGLLALDDDGRITAANRTARQMLPGLKLDDACEAPHLRDLFALPWEPLYDRGRLGQPVDAPLWSGLRLQIRPEQADSPLAPLRGGGGATKTEPLRDVQHRLIRQALEETGGNVALAARKLGISRATLYRKLSST